MPSTHPRTDPSNGAPAEVQPDSDRDAPTVDRDASNFDFRVVTFLLTLITREDLLTEYLVDGEGKDDDNVPLALWDRRKWKTLRTLFEPSMLADFLYLWERPQTQAAARVLRTVFQVQINLVHYDLDTCPDPAVLRDIVEYSGQLTTPLNAAGVGGNVGSKN